MTETFSELAKKAFLFLEVSGFQHPSFGEHELRYQSKNSFVIVKWDSRSGELDCYLGLVPFSEDPSRRYSLTDILKMQCAEEAVTRPYQIAKETKLEASLNTLSSNIRKYASSALEGDRMFFRRLETFRQAQGRKLLSDINSATKRARAESAWNSKKFDEFIAIYEALDGSLTEVEQKKLEIARRKLKPES
jgi:hypothetical protein